MAAYIDEHESRFKVGPIRRVLSESLDCGFLTSRGCRMFRTRPVSRMRAGHEALARDILQIHSDFFMAVYGYGVFCQVGVGRFGVSFSPCERRVSGRFGVGRSCWLLVIALVIA